MKTQSLTPDLGLIQAIDGGRTFTFLDLQPCRPLPTSRLIRLPSSKHSVHTDSPMHEEILSFRSKPLQELARPDLMFFKALELLHRPSHKRLIDISQQGIQRRWGISPVHSIQPRRSGFDGAPKRGWVSVSVPVIQFSPTALGRNDPVVFR